MGGYKKINFIVQYQSILIGSLVFSIVLFIFALLVGNHKTHEIQMNAGKVVDITYNMSKSQYNLSKVDPIAFISLNS